MSNIYPLTKMIMVLRKLVVTHSPTESIMRWLLGVLILPVGDCASFYLELP